MKVNKNVDGDNIIYSISLDEDTNTIKALSISETLGETELTLKDNILTVSASGTLANISSIIISIAEYKDTLIVDRYTEVLSTENHIESNPSKENVIQGKMDLGTVETGAKMFIPNDTKGYDEGFMEGLLIGSIIDRNF